MKLCFSTLGCPDWSWDDIVAAAADLGFNGIELRGIQSETYAPKLKILQPAQIEKTLARLTRLGLDIPCLTSGCDLSDGANRTKTLEDIRAYIDLAAAMGTPYVRLLGDDHAQPTHPISDDTVYAAASEAASYAADKNVTLLIETNGVYSNSHRLAALLERIGSQNVAALWDTHHTYRFVGESPSETVKNLGTWIRHAHFKDSVMHEGMLQYRIMGQGDVPAHNAVMCLEDIGYDGYYCFEWVRRWNFNLESPGIAFPQFLRYMRG